MISAKRHQFPLIVKRGSSTVKIYRDQKPSGTYYRVTYHIGGKRHRLNFNDLNKAILEAEAKASQLSRGDIDAAQLSGRDRLIYGRAVDAVKETGVPLDAVGLEYAEATRLLEGCPLLDAVRFFVRHQGRGIKRKTVPDAVSEIIETKKVGGVSEVYLADLRYRLGVFAQRFQCDLVSLTPDDVRGFFAALGLGARSFNNFAITLKTFFRFSKIAVGSQKKRICLQASNDAKRTARQLKFFRPQKSPGEARPNLAQCIALGAFAGLRSEEILRLEWADLRRRPGFIEIAADKAKTAARRLVPIAENLARWLEQEPPKTRN